MQQFGPSFYALERLWPRVAHDWAEYTKSKACCTICRELVGEGVKCRGCNYHVHRKCLSGTQDYCTQERIGFDLAQALMYAMADGQVVGGLCWPQIGRGSNSLLVLDTCCVYMWRIGLAMLAANW
jgi:hypothetical protein